MHVLDVLYVSYKPTPQSHQPVLIIIIDSTKSHVFDILCLLYHDCFAGSITILADELTNLASKIAFRG